MFNYSIYIPNASAHLWDGDNYVQAVNMFTRWHCTIPGVKLVLVNNSTGEIICDANIRKG